MSDPRDRLRRWFDAKGWSLREAATQMGCDPSYPGKIIKGLRQPYLELAVLIERLSADWDEGAIRATDWVVPRHHDESVPRHESVGEGTV